ncbi:MFS transporter [Deinococcus altitudinis]|uniref:MFS transporter n=1 Tax=Deinococcus altitudinis TaxID=468914 RepID=UPI0038924BD8
MTVAPYAPPPVRGFQTFLKLWASQGVSSLGSAAAWFSLTIYLAQTLYPLPSQRPELALGLAMLGVSGGLPALVAVPLAGIWADRADRRLTMLTCDLLSGLLALLTAFLMLRGLLPLWGLLGVSALTSLLGSFHGSAFDTSYGTLVGPVQLPRANGMMQTLWSLSGLLAPALAALLIAASGGVPLALAIDGLSFWLAGAVLWRLRFPAVLRQDDANQGNSARSFRDDLTFGWRYILARPPLLMLLLTFAAVNFSWSPLQVFDTLLLKGQLSADLSAHGLDFTAGLALFSTLSAVGGVAGGVLVSAWGGLKRRRVLGVLVPVLLGSVALATLGLSSSLWVAAPALLALFFTGPFMNAHSQAIWQAQVPAEMQGRVFSVRRLIAQFTSPVSVALAGVLATHAAVGSLLLGLAALVAAVALLQLLNPSLRKVEDRAYLEALALRRTGRERH